MSPIPENVKDPELYASIKGKIHKELDKEGKNWGVYASMMLVNRYKEAGGTYSDDKDYHRRKQLRKQQKKQQKKNPQPLTGVDRWFAEKWINICESRPPHKLVECGSSQKGYPVCRPYRRVSNQTPMTYQEMDKSAIQKICRDKSRNPSQYVRFKK
jgi:hypothetical protein